MGVEISQVQLDSFSKSWEETLRLNEIVPYQRGSEFAEEHFIISPEAKGATTGPWRCRPWQVDILDVMNSDEFYEVVWRKSSRMGASKMICATLLQAAVQKKFNAIIYQPDDDSSDKFVKSEIDPMLRDCPSLQPLKMKDSKKFDSLQLKVFNGSMWHLMGGATPKNYRARSADLVITDEVSAFERDIGGEGDGRALSRTRITESPFGKQINVSSPKFMPYCLITQALNEMDFVFFYYVPCPDCGHMQYMDFFEDGSRGITWDNDTAGLTLDERCSTARYCCESCEKKFTYLEMTKAQEKGKWITKDGKFWLEQGRVFDVNGHRNEKRWAIGFDSNVLISPAFSFSDFVREYLNAKEKYDNGNSGPMITFWNNRLGRAWVREKALTNIDYRKLITGAIEYPADGTIPGGILAITSAADIQGDRIECFTMGWGIGEESWMIDHTIFPGNTDQSEVWEMLELHWREKKYITEHGVELHILLHGIDHGGHWTQTVEAFCRENGVREYLPIKGALGVDKNIADFPKTPHKSGTWLVTNNTDPNKTLIYKRLAYERDPEKEVNPGVMNFPLQTPGYENFDKRFYKQVCSEVRNIKPSGAPEWLVSGRNEALDGISMNVCLIKVAQLPQYGLKLMQSANDVPHTRLRRKRRYDFRSMGSRLNTRR